MPRNLNGWRQNLAQVKLGIQDAREEHAEQTEKVKEALSRDDYRDALHHASGYLEANLQHMYKLWFYTWAPKWAVIIWLIVT